MPRLRLAHRAPRGFTLIEALLTMTLVSVAGAAMLTGLMSAMETNRTALEMTMAQGIAQQMIDDISARKYHDGDPYQVPMAASSYETSGPGYSRYNDIDDFHGYVDQPVADPWRNTLGTGNGLGGTRNANFQVRSGYFDRWRREVKVYYVSESDLVTPLTGSQTSNYRLVHVQVFFAPVQGTKRLLAEAKRVFANVPSN